MRTTTIAARSLYYGTPVALISTSNADGSDNLTPMSSSWSLRNRMVLGIGSASQAADNLRRCADLVVNLPSSAQWDKVEALSGLTGRADVPAHKAGQFTSAADKTSFAGLTWQASETVAPARVRECPIQMEAVVESLTEVADEPEGFVVVIARVNRVHAHSDILTADEAAIDPEKWTPLIFSFRSYHGLDATLGMMTRAVRR